jgi:hypothetical protein
MAALVALICSEETLGVTSLRLCLDRACELLGQITIPKA